MSARSIYYVHRNLLLLSGATKIAVLYHPPARVWDVIQLG